MSVKELQNFVRKYYLTAELLIFTNIDDKTSRFPTQCYFHVFVWMTSNTVDRINIILCVLCLFLENKDVHKLS